ncbi:hypothetical protein CEXT_78841 [Caerostris extrusa]|uniref:Uncharacterized protein n=1 Tax=Caerostris extrusa TaxID=172846 RepID=A0AAV4N6P7_CAEEX|nr:hypothetical protein CEXT_78841 [Caerostris extrusa]
MRLRKGVGGIKYSQNFQLLLRCAGEIASQYQGCVFEKELEELNIHKTFESDFGRIGLYAVLEKLQVST